MSLWSGAWPSLSIQQTENSLLSLAKVIEGQRAGASDEVSGALARFLVVRTCGYVEQIAEECCRAYLTIKSDHRSAAFGASWFGRGKNPNPEGLVQLVSKFDGTWAADLECLMREDDEFVRRELAFLVDRRNKIAHGLSEGIGVRKALDLVPTGRKIGAWFIRTFDPR
jgi:hypothetical protein